MSGTTAEVEIGIRIGAREKLAITTVTGGERR